MACCDETAAVEFWERHRWGDTPCCVHCGSADVYKMRDFKTGGRNKRYLWRCRDCKKQYTVRVGMVLEDSRIPLKHWCYALWRACTSKKGVAALEIKRQTGLSYKSSLFLMHRIRFAMSPTDNGPKLTGTVEADETYVGGKPRKRRPHRPDGKYTWQHKTKQPVFAAVQRRGEVRARVIPAVTKVNVGPMLKKLVDESSRLLTDEGPQYIVPGKNYADHQSVKHSAGEYVRRGTDIHTNTIESYFAIFKRGLFGIWHNVSTEHLHRYVSASEFRYNTRKLDDGDRVVAALRGAEGKRLMYREPIKKGA